MTGIIYIVATPIGNLADISQRAIDTLASVDFIVAEDTRHSQALLNHFNIKTPCMSLHDHNEAQRCEAYLARVAAGESLALISDAGTPLISDPGFKLVRAARQQGLTAQAIPGPCAAIAALSIAGLPSDKFIFAGFLPAKARALEQCLQAYQTETATVIFYESPRRVKASLLAIKTVLGTKRPVCLIKELTKLHETVVGDTVDAILDWLALDVKHANGEFVLVIGGCDKQSDADEQQAILKVLKPLLAAVPLKQAVSLTQEITGLRKNKIYELAIKLNC